jgi:hypothetical protein
MAAPHWEVSRRFIHEGDKGPHVPAFMYQYGRGMARVRWH